MSDRVDLVIEWTGTEGNINWEQWWVNRHGRTRHDIPTLDDYLSFIDFDLARNGLPRLARVQGRVTIPRVPRGDVKDATEIVEYHGFRVVR